MDHVHASLRGRLVTVLVAVVFALCLGWVHDASAATINFQSSRWISYNGGTGCNSGFTCTAQQACLSLQSSWPTGYTQLLRIDAVATPVGTYKAQGTCVIAKTDGTGSQNYSSIVSDTVYGGSAMDCTTTTSQNQYVGAWVVGGGSTAPAYACIQGCQYPQGSIAVVLQSTYGMEVGKGNGQTCNAANYDSIDTTTKKDDPPSLVSCGKMGLTYGTVNGVGICAKSGEVPGTTVTKTDTSTTTNTDASGVQASPQTSNTTTNVTNVNGVPTVTQTTTKPDGTKTSTTDTKDSFCSKNPNDAVCKTVASASGGDDCKTAPVCKGDAIQCAMLNQQWHTRCDSNQQSAYSDLGQKLLDGADPVANPASSGQRTVKNVGSSIDQSTFLAGGSGLTDKVLTVSGQTITLPFSRLNQYLVWIGHLFVVMSLIGAIRIVLGGFK